MTTTATSTPTINDRISRAAVYMEPDLYNLVHKDATQHEESLSTWLRRIAIERLVADNKMPQDLLLKLASK